MTQETFVRLTLEPPLGSLHTDDVLRSVSLTRHDVGRTQVHVGHGSRENDVHCLVERHLQTVRGESCGRR